MLTLGSPQRKAIMYTFDDIHVCVQSVQARKVATHVLPSKCCEIVCPKFASLLIQPPIPQTFAACFIGQHRYGL